MSSSSAYEDRRFWEAYARFLCCVKEGALPDGLDRACHDIALRLSKLAQRRRTNQVRVLCLGFGVGTFEYPLLHGLRHALSQDGNKTLAVTAIDSSRPALSCAQAMGKKLWVGPIKRELPFKDADAFANLVTSCWPAEEVREVERNGHPQIDFRALDLDLNSESDGFQRYLPSRWFEKLNGEQQTYDLVVFMFCLHHLNWWRATLAAAACRLLAPGGYLIVPEARGATEAFTGSPLEPSFCRDGRDLLECLRRVMFGGGADQGVAFLSRELQARMALPEVSGFLGGLDAYHAGDFEFEFSNRIDVGTCQALLETRGFGPLRRLEEAISTDEYERRLSEFKENCSSCNPCDAVHAIRLGLFEVPRQRHAVRSAFAEHFCVAPARSAAACRQSVAASVLARRAIEAHQFREASLLIPPGVESGGDPAAVFVKHTLPAILRSGVLHPSCACLTMGPGLVRREKLHESICLPNVFWSGRDAAASSHEITRRVLVEEQLEDLLVFLWLRHTYLGLENFSNMNLVLRELLPLFSPTPAIFTYAYEEPEKKPAEQDPFLRLELHRHRAFWELRHVLGKTHPYMEHIARCASARERLGTALWDAIAQRRLSCAAVKRRPTLAACPAVWFDEFEVVAETPAVAHHLKALRKAVEQMSLSEQIQKDWAAELEASFSYECVSQCPEAARRLGERNQNRNQNRPVFTPPALKAMALLALMRHCDLLVIYPAHFPSGEHLIAHDATVAMYTTQLDSGALEGEYAKFNAIYDAAALRRSAQAGAGQASANLAHEFKRVAESLRNLVVPATRVVTQDDKPLFTIETTQQGEDTGSVCGRIVLTPSLPEALRTDIGVSFYPTGVGCIAAFANLWCGAPTSADLKRLVGLDDVGSISQLANAVWNTCLRLVSLAGEPTLRFYGPRLLNADAVRNRLSEELHRLNTVAQLAERVGLCLHVCDNAGSLRGYDDGDISWLGRALLAMLLDYVLHSPSPVAVRLQSSETDGVGVIDVWPDFTLPTVEPSEDDTRQLENMRTAARAAYAGGDQPFLLGWHTADVVSFCLNKIAPKNGRPAALRREPSESARTHVTWQLCFSLRPRKER